MAFLDNISLTKFKSCVQEETRRLNYTGLAEGLSPPQPLEQSVDAGSDRVSANCANRQQQTTSPMRCDFCGYNNHVYKDCRTCIAEEYNRMQASHLQQHGRGRGRRKNRGNNNNSDNGTAYSAIFGGLAYCSKIARKGRVKRIRQA